MLARCVHVLVMSACATFPLLVTSIVFLLLATLRIWEVRRGISQRAAASQTCRQQGSEGAKPAKQGKTAATKTAQATADARQRLVSRGHCC